MATYLTLAGYIAAYWIMGELFATYRRAVLTEDAQDARNMAGRPRAHQGLLWFTAADALYLVAVIWLAARWTDGWKLRVCILMSPVAYANCVRLGSRLALLYHDRRSVFSHERRHAHRHTLTATVLLSEINIAQKAGLLLLGVVTVMPLLSDAYPPLGRSPLHITLSGFFAYSILPGLTGLILLVPTLRRLRRESKVLMSA